jgi:leucyl-tRNA synthetase
MKDYDFKKIEDFWQDEWRKKNIYKVTEDASKPKYYVLDMFPYPSGAGLHVGHPLGYIASDIYARFKRLKGFNVLHPMGYDAFGLPAEQYAIQTGQHPEKTTKENIARYREQLDKIGFSYDWDREVRTSDPNYYKWTQWIFIKLFHSWYNPETDKAEPIEDLIKKFKDDSSPFTVDSQQKKWDELSEKEQSDVLMEYRLAYLAESSVNWCPQLGTVLANDEVKDGVSERGGYPVERKLMLQWSLRISKYADRLLESLDNIDWTDSLKEAQRNWIGRSEGTSLKFVVCSLNSEITTNHIIEVFTTRPDTIFGVSFVTLAPEHELVSILTTPDKKAAVEEYVAMAKNRSERERLADVKKISGEFTGSYAVHPFTGKQIPIWVGDYVLAGYGTGAVMAVPSHDSRDFAFAKHFGLERPVVIQPPVDSDFADQSYDEKNGRAINSDFLNGLETKDAIKKAIEEIEKRNLGKGKTNYRLRDAIFGRQRYWGEPIPVYYKDGIPYTVDEKKLPIILPEIDKYLPTENGEPPLARATNWKYEGIFDFETTTMPGWAGSSWYFLRYMDNKNANVFVSKEAVDYWKQIDLYLGGSEHATGHLLYFRFWTKFLYDLGLIPFDEPAKKLINQGMIQGMSSKIHLARGKSNAFHSASINRGKFMMLNFGNNTYRIAFSKTKFDESLNKLRESDSFKEDEHFRVHMYKEGINVPVQFVKENDSLDLNSLLSFKKSQFEDMIFICEDGLWFDYKFISFDELENYKTGEFQYNIDPSIFKEYDKLPKFKVFYEVEKMSKSKDNVITPDEVIDDYGADTLRLYEMFLGPLEQSKPWNTQGIEGVHRFLKKLWKLFFVEGNFVVTDEEPNKKELKSIHKLIKKVGEDIENFSFNTSVPAFMICVNELTDLKCNKKKILTDYLVCLSPYAPHISEELWAALGNETSIVTAKFPAFNPEFLIEDSFSYPISINGKHRTNIEMGMDMPQAEVEQLVMNDEIVLKWLEGKQPKKIIFVKGKIVNVVV